MSPSPEKRKCPGCGDDWYRKNFERKSFFNIKCEAPAFSFKPRSLMDLPPVLPPTTPSIRIFREEVGMIQGFSCPKCKEATLHDYLDMKTLRECPVYSKILPWIGYCPNCNARYLVGYGSGNQLDTVVDMFEMSEELRTKILGRYTGYTRTKQDPEQD